MVSHKTLGKKDKNGERKIYTYYQCRQYKSKGHNCKANSIKSKEIENAVIDRIFEFIKRPDLIDLIAEQTIKKNLPEKQFIIEDINKLNLRLSELKKKEAIYYEYLSDQEKLKILKEEKILEQISRINIDAEAVQAELNLVEQKLLVAEHSDATVEELAYLLKNFKLIFEVANVEDKKKLIHSLVEKVLINPSENIDERTVKSVILKFDSIDISHYLDDKKVFELTYDTVHLS